MFEKSATLVVIFFFFFAGVDTWGWNLNESVCLFVSWNFAFKYVIIRVRHFYWKSFNWQFKLKVIVESVRICHKASICINQIFPTCKKKKIMIIIIKFANLLCEHRPKNAFNIYHIRIQYGLPCYLRRGHTVVLLYDVVLVQKYVYDLLLHRTRTFVRC